MTVTTVYVPAPALHKGVRVYACTTTHTGTSLVDTADRWRTFARSGQDKEWFTDREKALDEAERLRLRRIATLEKQLGVARALGPFNKGTAP